MPSTAESVDLWYQALNEPLGIYILTPEPVLLKSTLYAARARSKDPSIAHLQIRTPPPDHILGRNYPGLDPHGSLWIINPREAP